MLTWLFTGLLARLLPLARWFRALALVVLGLLHSWCALPLGLTLHTLTRMILRLLDARRLRALANLACLLGRRLPALARRFALLIGLSLAIHVFALLQSFTLLHGLALLHTFTHLSVAILSNTI